MITHGNELIASREHLPLPAHGRNSKDLPAILRSGCHQQNPHTENLHVNVGAEGGQRFQWRSGGQLNGRRRCQEWPTSELKLPLAKP
jgi:hypothetical protein